MCRKPVGFKRLDGIFSAEWWLISKSETDMKLRKWSRPKLSKYRYFMEKTTWNLVVIAGLQTRSSWCISHSVRRSSGRCPPQTKCRTLPSANKMSDTALLQRQLWDLPAVHLQISAVTTMIFLLRRRCCSAMRHCVIG